MIVLLAASLLLVAPVDAQQVTVTIAGDVVFNGISDPELSAVQSGDKAVMSFTVDAMNFDEGAPGDTRGYVIEKDSFSLAFTGPDTDVSVGLVDPFPAGQQPYFTLVDGFPVADGFFVSTSTISPGGVPLAQEPLNANFEVGYEGETLDSLDILDAVGTYDFDGLTRFGYSVWQISPDNVRLGIDFSQMTIVPEPASLVLLAPLTLLLLRRRHR
jgi:hypothetical protein